MVAWIKGCQMLALSRTADLAPTAQGDFGHSELSDRDQYIWLDEKLKKSGNNLDRRFHVSQDRREIYLVLAESSQSTASLSQLVETRH
ncbi:hypothetical protein BDW62DRAFT_175044 [Aspergillus aurantiobrunneus]